MMRLPCALGPYNQEYMNDIVYSVDELDFKKIIYRAPIINILMDYIAFEVDDE